MRYTPQQGELGSHDLSETVRYGCAFPGQQRRPGKRLLDVTIAATILIVTTPVLLAIALAIKLSSRGPVLFRQARVGHHGHDFVMFKFRTMRTGCSADSHRAYVTKMLLGEVADLEAGGLYKLHGDPRVTGVGHFLRRFSLDELPQLLNVLRGEMSLVGPRPALHYEVSLYEPQHLLRFLAPPGMTGLWQVSGRSRLSMRQALDLDVEYVQAQSMRLDLLILLRTAPAVFRGEDAA
jgi:lipopolysaccharide/colanic/teichoic acid biosynthesis glycosyltransferase